MKKLLLALLMFFGVACAGQEKFVLKSPEFTNKESIPEKYGFKFQDISPPLIWSGAPKQVKSFALIVIDYDTKPIVGHATVHWVMYNIPKKIMGLSVADKRFPMGLNSYKTYGYRGMNPPHGQIHNYHFYLYALNVEKIEFTNPPTAKELREKIHDNILDTATIVGNFSQ